MARRSPALVVLSAALIAAAGARGVSSVAVGGQPAPQSSPQARPVATAVQPTLAPMPVIVPEAEEISITRAPEMPPARYADMAAIYAGLPASRASVLVSRLPTEDAAALLHAMPRDAASAILSELDDEVAVKLTLVMARGAS